MTAKAKTKPNPKAKAPAPEVLVLQELRDLLRNGVNSTVRYSHLTQLLQKHDVQLPEST